MPLKKSKLYSSIWASCDELRGGMDASQYKDYVLVLLFVKYVSDKYAGQPYAPVDVPSDGSFAAMAKMNMILHGNPAAEIRLGNTLASPHWAEGNRLKRFDFAVANPPFSNKAWRTGFDPENDVYRRFELGIPPNKNGDYAFLLHILTSLKSTGKGAVVLPHGVLFRGNVEADIRRE
jgi:type I restriction-modification system DNA methylase subunit